MNHIENELINRFHRLYQQKKLAHFYILETEDDRKTQVRFLQDLLTKISAQSNEANGHPDVLILEPETDQYLAEQASIIEYMRSWEFKPTNLKYRFFIFMQSHKLSQVILNKMLKQLEEPPSYSCILFLNSSSRPLLQTIESRSIKWKLPPRQIPSWHENSGNFMDWLKCYFEFFLSEKILEDLEINISEFADLFFDAIKGKPWELFEISRSRPEIETAITQATLEFFQYKVNDAAPINALFEQLKFNQESRKYNNDHKIRIDLLLEFWKKTLFQKK